MLVPATKKRKPSKKQAEKGLGFTICEGILTECIEQTYRALGVFYHNQSKLPAHTVMLGVFGVARSEAAAVRDLFDGIQDAVLNPKHRLARDVVNTFLKSQEDFKLAELDDIEHPEFARFAQHLTDFLTTLHIILHDSTTHYTRNKKYKTFVEKYIDYAPEKVQEKYSTVTDGEEDDVNPPKEEQN